MTATAAPATKPKANKDDFFAKSMQSRGAVYWPQNLSYLITSHGMNYFKVLCLQHRASPQTGDSCGNKRHDADKYLHTLECEAQLTEALVIAMQGADQKIADLNAALLKIHADMDCECGWKPQAHPPLNHFIKVKCPSRAYKIRVRVL